MDNKLIQRKILKLLYNLLQIIMEKKHYQFIIEDPKWNI